MLALLFLSVGAIALVSDTSSAQQQRLQVRPAATGNNAPERTNTTPDTTQVSVALPGPTDDKTSALGQALAACNQDIEKVAFTLMLVAGLHCRKEETPCRRKSTTSTTVGRALTAS
jgi:hypothetical protein